MDPALASIIAAIISAIASIAVAIITTRATRPKDSAPQMPKIPGTAIAISYRQLAWAFVLFLYCIAAYLAITALRAEYFVHWVINHPDEAIAWFDKTFGNENENGFIAMMGFPEYRRQVEQQVPIYLVAAAFCLSVAVWSTWRLWRRALPNSN